MARIAAAALAAAALALPARATAQPAAGTIAFEDGPGPGLGRVLVTVPHGVGFHARYAGDRLVLLLKGAGAIASAVSTLPAVLSADGGQDQVTLTLAPKTRARVSEHHWLVAVDIDATGATLPAQAPAKTESQAKPAPSATAAADGSHGGGAKQLPDGAAQASPAPSPASGASQSVVQGKPGGGPGEGGATTAAAEQAANAQPGAEQLAAARLAGAAGDPPAILLPFGRDTGAAAFSLHGMAHAVFGDPRPVDMAALKDDPVFSGARIHLLPEGTDLTMRLPEGSRFALRHSAEGWVVGIAGAPARDGATLELKAGVLTIRAQGAAQTLTMTDPETGGRLLIGAARGVSPGIPVPRTGPEFRLLPSWQGVVVEAAGDRLALRAAKTGFTLQNDPGPKLAVSGDFAGSQSPADALTRYFAFSGAGLPELRQRATTDLTAAAAAPKLNRAAARRRAAADFLALGLAREAAGLLSAAAADDPAQADAPDQAALTAMAAYLTDPTPDSDRTKGLDAAGIPASDEIAFWRALARPASHPGAGATLAATWPVMLGYMPTLRHALAQAVVAALMASKQDGAADALLDQVDDPALGVWRARRLAAAGKQDQALALLDRVAAGSNRKQGAEAAKDAIELRLATGKLTAAQAADAMTRQIYAWREPETEIAVRLRAAGLLADAGKWRPSLAMLRETDGLFPEAHARIGAAQGRVVQSLLDGGAAGRVSPLDLVALADENAALLGGQEASARLLPILAEKLMALDLPDRAEPVMGRLVAATSAAEPKADLAVKLAAIRLDQHRPEAALAALDMAQAAGPPTALAEAMRLTRARALQEEGRLDEAAASLAGDQSADALDLTAALNQRKHAWREEEQALQALVAQRVPASGALQDADRALVLRLATAATQAEDSAGLQDLQAKFANRLGDGPQAKLFAALAQAPVRVVADLARSGREAAVAAAVPAAITGLQHP
jgi:hypothetical protein